MIIIGREPPAELVIPRPQVSARHASVKRLDEQTFLIKDLGSLNGTFVNGERIRSMVIRPSDAVKLGAVPLDWDLLLSSVPSASRRAPAHAFAPVSAPVAIIPRKPEPWREVLDGGPAVQDAPVATVIRQPSPAPRTPAGAPPLSSDLAAALAAQKTYGSKAFFVWFLYWVGWIPGLVMNLVYLSEANNVQRQTGVSPSGKGCLVVLLVLHVLLPLVVILVLAVGGGSVLTGLLN